MEPLAFSIQQPWEGRQGKGMEESFVLTNPQNWLPRQDILVAIVRSKCDCGRRVVPAPRLPLSSPRMEGLPCLSPQVSQYLLLHLSLAALPLSRTLVFSSEGSC